MRLLKRTLCIMITAMIAVSALASCSGGEPYEKLDLASYITLGEFSDISVTEAELDAELEEYISAFLKSNSTKTQIKEGSLSAGDIAVVDYECRPSGSSPDSEPILSDTDCNIVIGSGKYFHEIEDALTSIPVGARDPLQIYVSVPEDHVLAKLSSKDNNGNSSADNGKNNSDEASKKPVVVIYTVTLKEAYRLAEPVYDDALVSEKTAYTTVDEHRAALREQALYALVWEELIERTSVERYPESEVSERKLDFIEHYTDLANESRITLDEYVLKKFFIESAAFHLKADEYAKSRIKEEMMVYSIMRSYDLAPDDDEYRSAAEAYAVERGCASVSELERRYGSSTVRYTVIKDRVLSFVTAHSSAAAMLEPQTDAEQASGEHEPA